MDLHSHAINCVASSPLYLYSFITINNFEFKLSHFFKTFGVFLCVLDKVYERDSSTESAEASPEVTHRSRRSEGPTR